MYDTNIVASRIVYAKRDELEEKAFETILINLAEKYNPNDHTIHEYIGMRRSTIEMIEKDGHWLHEKDGFNNRFDFRYNSEGISFSTGYIQKVNGVYTPISKLTSVAEDYHSKRKEVFDLLGKIEAVLDRFYRTHKEEADKAFKYCLGDTEVKDQVDPQVIKNINIIELRNEILPKNQIERKTGLEAAYITDMFKQYGKLFIASLTMILNRLEEVEDLKEVVNEFVNTYFKLALLSGPNESNTILEGYKKIPYALIELIEKYSFRGPQFAQMAKIELERKIEGFFSFEEEKPTTGSPKM